MYNKKGIFLHFSSFHWVVISRCCLEMPFFFVFPHRVVVRKKRSKPNSIWTPRTKHKRSPVERNPSSRPLLQLGCCQKAGTTGKPQWKSRKRANVLHIFKPSLCGSPFPLYCRSPTGEPPPSLRPGTRAARLRSCFRKPLFITQVDCFFFFLFFFVKDACSTLFYKIF